MKTASETSFDTATALVFAGNETIRFEIVSEISLNTVSVLANTAMSWILFEAANASAFEVDEKDPF